MAILALTEGLDCRNCNEYQKQDRGCIEDSPIPQRWRVGEHESNRCPLKIATSQSREYILAYSMFKMNILPHGKGWVNETKKFLEAMNIIGSELQEKPDARQ
jgi:hypothetical protein